jgi:D-alanyl-D-alanine carboxypeptidase
MRSCRRTLALIGVLLAFAARAASADAIDDFVRGQMQAFALPGVSLAIVQDGKVVRAQAYGVADVAKATPATPDTVFQIASVSKQFIAAGILLLAQDGRLTVDDPVGRHLEGTPPSWQPITIRHLLTHTSGIVRESPAFDWMKPKPDADVVRAAYPLPLRFAPGTKWEYCNVGYFALAEIITRVSGTPWTRFLQDRVFTPVGMAATAPTNVTPAPARLALGYGGKDNGTPARAWVALRPSGAFLSTVGDLAKWDARLYGETPLTEASKRQMWTAVRLNDGGTHGYGFGLHVDTLADGRRVAWHTGGLPGFASYFGRFLDDRVTVILLTNGNDVDARAIGNGVADRYLARPR